MAEKKPSRVLAIVLVIVVVAAGSAGIGVLYYENTKLHPQPQLTVQQGDNVTVNYIGIFGSSPQAGRVFDTSIYEVALNNLTWPKSLGYHSRGGQPSDYTPLPVHVGLSGSYSLNNQTFGTVVPGFWQGLLGLPGNQTRVISVSPSLGYGNPNASCLVTQPLSYTVPVTVALPRATFTTTFPSVALLAGSEFTDPTYGWTDLVLSVNASAVVYQNLPTLGFTFTVPGWPVAVTALNSTTITLTNQLTVSNAGLVGGSVTGSGVCGSTSFIVSQVSTSRGFYTENFNSEVVGQTLIFAVTVVDIFPPSSS
jgi:FKBP-type peptidyl-prolyl cis-trans isomerase 2